MRWASTLQIREPARIGGVGGVAADALEMIALEIELLRLAQSRFGQARVLAEQRGAEQRPESLVLPARIRHDPVEVVEHARDQMIGITLRAGQPSVDRQPVLGGDVGDDGVAVADRLARVDDIGQLAARRRRRVENVLMPERHAGELAGTRTL